MLLDMSEEAAAAENEPAVQDGGGALGPAFRLSALRFDQAPGELSCWIAQPAKNLSGASPKPPLVAVHGITRDARQQAKLLAAAVCATGRTIIAPHFPSDRWRPYQRVVAGPRADLALLRLMDRPELAAFTRPDMRATPTFHVFGYSGGAQFAHRFALLHPERVRSLTIASAGWYTFPDDAPFPYGFGPPRQRPCDGWSHGPVADWGARMRGNLGAFLDIPTLVLIGGRDCVVDRNTRRGADIDRQQGRARIARARNWSRAMASAAEAMRCHPHMEFRVLPGCGHSFADCVRIGGLDGIVVDAVSDAETGIAA